MPFNVLPANSIPSFHSRYTGTLFHSRYLIPFQLYWHLIVYWTSFHSRYTSTLFHSRYYSISFHSRYYQYHIPFQVFSTSFYPDILDLIPFQAYWYLRILVPHSIRTSFHFRHTGTSGILIPHSIRTSFHFNISFHSGISFQVAPCNMDTSEI